MMTENASGDPLFNLEAVFHVDDYLFAYGDELTAARSEAEVAWVIKLLEIDAPMRILDLACGFGRHANRLAALGHQVTGVDYMPEFLDLARQGATELGVHVDYRQGDMRDVRFEAEFDRVLLLFTSFGYFEDRENERVIANMARALKPGGWLMLDVANRDTALKDLPPADVIEKGGDLLINRFSFDPLTGRFTNRRIVIRESVRKDKPFSIRLYSATEMAQLLERAGLGEYRLLDEDGAPLSSRSRRMVVLARKPGPQ
ncbi:MAG: class I SAM-dependent methyltransferase [Anaerolineae bacterium]|nr:class I SAM-dependent methyltransferase [Anaerolineae bacterium]